MGNYFLDRQYIQLNWFSYQLHLAKNYKNYIFCISDHNLPHIQSMSSAELMENSRQPDQQPGDKTLNATNEVNLSFYYCSSVPGFETRNDQPMFKLVEFELRRKKIHFLNDNFKKTRYNEFNLVFKEKKADILDMQAASSIHIGKVML